VQATGDFLHGTAEVARNEHNLAFSSAAVARSACEYASIGWWLADPGISVDDRIARTARVAYDSIQAGKSLRNREERREYEAQNAPILDWAQKNLSGKHRFPDATHRFQAMNPTYGRHDYHQYSSVAHGDLAITAKLVREKEGDLAEDPTEPLWRILAACQYSLQLATRVSELRDVAVEHLPGLWEMFAMFGTQFDAYQIHVASRAAAHDEAPPEP
jgi:hypothetical protein